MYAAAEPIEQQNPIYLTNRDALAHLEQEREFLVGACRGLGGILAARREALARQQAEQRASDLEAQLARYRERFGELPED